ncbi:membrane protein [Labrys miyagiensis]|uniref:Membrane protein n=1 Tax=Labrys miyagiensis TaxID=346912 RepID=A0ABQ6CGE6_9HYPH|nr:CbtA family protein [Labrys miyagiensis]GLS19428.1 membrane protein [Labrys miyagiensis]
MVRDLLVRGMLVGILAGLLCFGFLKIYGEPQVDRAIAFETQMDEAKAKAEMAKGMPMPADEPELVSRLTQASWGLLTGVMAYNIAFGGLFALAFAFVFGRLEATSSPRVAAVLVALTGFIAIYLVPNLKYPANPPSVGNPDTIGIRTGLYFLMIAISLGTMILAANMRKALVGRWGNWNATLIVAASYLAVVVIAALLMPVIDEVPEGFPAVILWKFRVASMGAQTIMWSTLALVFGAFAEKLMVQKRVAA